MAWIIQTIAAALHLFAIFVAMSLGAATHEKDRKKVKVGLWLVSASAIISLILFVVAGEMRAA